MIAAADAPTKPKTLTLQDLADEALALRDLWEMDEGEVKPEAEALELELLEKLATKGDGYGDFHTELKNQIALTKALEAPLTAEAERLRAKRKTLENKLEWMSRNVALYLQRTGQQRIEGERWKVRAQKNGQPAMIVDVFPAALPPKYQQWEIKVNNELLKQDLEAGTEVAGARLQYGYHTRVW